ncbi:RVT 1 domain containing protein [Asbolus verrucosus]|uniref:RVT 1 domain containing protein n=1 Tax=Asbolus verrucosus TaxID=1661398 RepID=A0A482W8H6_ASBVE|nr:RVT 1 domain containing protein [Asbolus verrucosus]
MQYMYTADIPKTARTQLAIYGDDTTILTRASQPWLVTQLLQEAVDDLENWFRKWLIKVNPEKSTAILIKGRKKGTHDGMISMNQRDIPWRREIKYLAVTIDDRLTFILQVN